ncbi:Rho GTPase-activating protein 20-like protein [Leptotrombidium deliense]|uniref:Rho GTPase-activating protein 20-like protein n=1 Tax=Leptotrombidium deliense TaxID=299467 RepID=A0A443SVD3_9ACAR|nr:Rho GTPase-activating protein 20-like protein [Leptotrombidium deliense]
MSRILRRMVNMSPFSPEDDKKLKKGRTLNWPFKKNSPKHCSDNVHYFPMCPSKLFGQPLVKYVSNGTPITPVMNMLRVLRVKGPYTVGIFRKSANARVCRELKAKLDDTPNCSFDEFPVIVIASVFKEFLRSLPDCLLQSKLYYKWIEAVNVENNFECRERVGKLLRVIPAPNFTLLRYFVCVLWHISNRSAENKMCSLNLAVCIGPSLLCNKQQASILRCEEISKQVPKLVAYLIEHSPELFGDSTLKLFDDFCDVYKRDSGAEESDSLKSLQDTGVVLNSSCHTRRDDSSVDSLERFSMEENSAQTHYKENSTFENKVSLSNLSRDSGLTLSDTQLYSPEDESETCDITGVLPDSRLLPHFTKSVPHLDSADLENVINVTFSYGRSVGVSIDGSCHDVVHKRRHHDVSNKGHAVFGVLGCSRKEDHTPINRNHHSPVQYSESYCCGINNQSTETDPPRKNEICCPRSSRYRHRRPPLAAVLRNHSPAIMSPVTLRRTSSEESIRVNYELEGIVKEPISLSYGCAKSEFEIDALVVNEASKQSIPHSGITNVRIPLQGNVNENLYSHNSHVKFHAQQAMCKDRVGSMCSSSSDTASQHSSASKQSSHSNRSAVTSAPPSYQETMNRKELLARVQSNTVASRQISSTSAVSSSHIYEQSVRVYNEDIQKGSNVFMRAIPARVKANDSDGSDSETIAIQCNKQLLCRISSEKTQAEICPQKKPLRFCNSVKPKNANENCNNITVEERCAKDFENDWRKDVSWSVAQLRTLFSGQSIEENGLKKMPKTSEITNNQRHIDKVANDSLDDKRRNGKENCVTVIRVAQNELKDVPITISNHSSSLLTSHEESYV